MHGSVLAIDILARPSSVTLSPQHVHSPRHAPSDCCCHHLICNTLTPPGTVCGQEGGSQSPGWPEQQGVDVEVEGWASTGVDASEGGSRSGSMGDCKPVRAPPKEERSHEGAGRREHARRAPATGMSKRQWRRGCLGSEGRGRVASGGDRNDGLRWELGDVGRIADPARDDGSGGPV